MAPNRLPGEFRRAERSTDRCFDVRRPLGRGRRTLRRRRTQRVSPGRQRAVALRVRALRVDQATVATLTDLPHFSARRTARRRCPTNGAAGHSNARRHDRHDRCASTNTRPSPPKTSFARATSAPASSRSSSRRHGLLASVTVPHGCAPLFVRDRRGEGRTLDFGVVPRNGWDAFAWAPTIRAATKAWRAAAVNPHAARAPTVYRCGENTSTSTRPAARPRQHGIRARLPARERVAAVGAATAAARSRCATCSAAIIAA